VSTAYTPHVCSITGSYRCSGTSCGAGSDRYDGVCDKDGCDYNSYRTGNTTFFGPGQTVDTNQVFTVLTQFLTTDGTATGDLSEIRRYYIQNGKVIPNSAGTYSSISSYNSVTDSFCNAQKTLFGDQNTFESIGGLKSMGEAMGRGMVLVMSLWDDYAANMLWLDSLDPSTGSASTPGVARGTCATTSGVPKNVESQSPGASVQFSNIKWGALGTTTAVTTSGSGATATTVAGPTTGATAIGPGVATATGSTGSAQSGSTGSAQSGSTGSAQAGSTGSSHPTVSTTTSGKASGANAVSASIVFVAFCFVSSVAF